MQKLETLRLLDNEIVSQFYAKCSECRDIYIDVTVGEYEMLIKALLNISIACINLEHIDIAILTLKSVYELSHKMNDYTTQEYGYTEFSCIYNTNTFYDELKEVFQKEKNKYCTCGNYPYYNDTITPKYCTNCNKPLSPQGYLL